MPAKNMYACTCCIYMDYESGCPSVYNCLHVLLNLLSSTIHDKPNIWCKHRSSNLRSYVVATLSNLALQINLPVPHPPEGTCGRVFPEVIINFVTTVDLPCKYSTRFSSRWVSSRQCVSSRRLFHCLASTFVCPLRYPLACSESILLTRHNQERTQWSPDPFPRERVGSGHELTIDKHVSSQASVGRAHASCTPTMILIINMTSPL